MAAETEKQTTTLFLRGMPRRVVREAKAAAARRGSTLAKLVADALERSFAEAEGPTVDHAEFDRSVEWFETNRDRILRAHEGEYVAIARCEILDHDEDFESLARRVFRREGPRAVYIPFVERTRRTIHFRSPRLAP